MAQVVSREPHQRASLDVRLDHRADGLRVRPVSESAEGLGGASLQDRLRILERVEEHGTGRALADQTERERRHLPHFDLAIGKETRQRLDAFRQPDASDGQRGTTTHASLVIAEEPDEIGRCRWSNDGRFPLGRGSQHDLGRRIGVAKDALILEADDPAQFLFPGDDARNGRNGGDRGAAAGDQRDAGGNDPDRLVHRLAMIACSLEANARLPVHVISVHRN